MSLGNIKDSMVDKDFEEIKKECTSELRLDLGCGNNKKENFIGLDFSLDSQADIVHDLNSYPYPFDDSCAFEIFSSHFFEHVDDIKKFMEECYRLLIPGGILEIICPYYTSIRATQDFTHKNFISENTFLYFNKNWMITNKLDHYGVSCNFSIDSIKYIYSSEWQLKSDEAKEWARKHYLNTVMDIHVILRAIK